MDSTVIEEIANQLGMAVDDVGTFIQSILPSYAGMQIVNNLIPCILAGVAIVFCVFFMVHLIKDGKKPFMDRRYEDDIRAILMCVGAALIILSVVVLCFTVSNIIGWAMFPEGKFFDMILNSISCA